MISHLRLSPEQEIKFLCSTVDDFCNTEWKRKAAALKRYLTRESTDSVCARYGIDQTYELGTLRKQDIHV